MAAPPDEMFSGEFSASGQYLYVATNSAYDSAFVIQIDLQNPLHYYAADTVGMISYPIDGVGFLKTGPVDKIYFACSWYDGINFNFPYPDTTFNIYNTHLSIINSPDSMGIACNFTPFSFYLGGNRTYYGLPNNPDYDLPRLQGSSCDRVLWTDGPPGPSLLAQTSLSGAGGVLYPNPAKDKINIETDLVLGDAEICIYNLLGEKCFTSKTKTATTKITLDVSPLNQGLYLLQLKIKGKVWSKKFFKD